MTSHFFKRSGDVILFYKVINDVFLELKVRKQYSLSRRERGRNQPGDAERSQNDYTSAKNRDIAKPKAAISCSKSFLSINYILDPRTLGFLGLQLLKKTFLPQARRETDEIGSTSDTHILPKSRPSAKS